jgi:hypothetical protein
METVPAKIESLCASTKMSGMSDPSFINEGRRARALLLVASECIDKLIHPGDSPGIVTICETSTKRTMVCEVSGLTIVEESNGLKCIRCQLTYRECRYCAGKRSWHELGNPPPILAGEICIQCNDVLEICYGCVRELYTAYDKNVANDYGCALCEYANFVCNKCAVNRICYKCQTPVKLCQWPHIIHTSLSEITEEDPDDVDCAYAMLCYGCQFKE